VNNLLLSTLALTCLAAPATAQKFVVANRASGDITVFDRNGGTQATVPLPGGVNPAEPMYVVQVRDEIVVGDRANNCIVRFDKRDYSIRGTVILGNGVFHMWSNGRQLWVNNDVDNTSSVVDTRTWQVTATVSMPPDLVAQGYKCHDVFVSHRFAYVSMLGGAGTSDYVVQFRLSSKVELRRAAVGKDPHLWFDGWTGKLFVASQNGNAVAVLDGRTLAQRQSVAVPGAHGIYLPPYTRTLLVTNLPGGGSDGLISSRVGFGGALSVRDTIDTPYATPHNVAASAFGHRIFVTHSGATATKVSIFRLRGLWNPRLELVGEADAGLNPFGLAVVY